MQTTWQIQEAKSRFSELIGLSLTQGPQTITRHGRAVVQVVAINTKAQPGAENTVKAASASNEADDADGFTRHLLNAPTADTVLELPLRRNRKGPLKLGT